MNQHQNIHEIQGRCDKCKGPIFLNRSMDWYGNSIVTLNCWNGHYKWINIENLDACEDLAPETKRDLVTHISFFNL
jgi:hypothetical protein